MRYYRPVTKHDFAGMKTSIDLDAITPMMHWEARKALWEKDVRSKAMWYGAMTKGEREAVKERVLRAIEVMHDNVDVWLPHALSLDDLGASLLIEYSMTMTDIERDVAEAQLVTTRRVKEAAGELKGILKEMDDE